MTTDCQYFNQEILCKISNEFDSCFSPASYWLFTYLFDIITSVIWFCYLLAIYCIFDVAFNGVPSKKSSSEAMGSFEFATPWDLRVQFYPLTIIIVLPTLPFVYLLTKLFRSDILVCIEASSLTK